MHSSVGEIEIDSNLGFEIDNSLLEITANRFPRKLTLNQEIWAKFDTIHVFLDKSNIPAKDKVLLSLLENTCQVKSLTLNFNFRSITDEQAFVHFSMIFSPDT